MARARTLLAADLLGCMEAALDAALEHASVREQFGVKIGSFQAIQHLCADAFVRTESVRSAVWYATWAVDHVDTRAARLAALTAKVAASEAVIEVVETSIQVHGGIAIIFETLPHLYLRRGLLGRRTLGDEAELLDSIADVRLAVDR